MVALSLSQQRLPLGLPKQQLRRLMVGSLEALLLGVGPGRT